MTDPERLIEEALRVAQHRKAGINVTGTPDLLTRLARALEDCEKERDDYKHAAGAEAQLADLNMERAKAAEQRVKELEEALLYASEGWPDAKEVAAQALAAPPLPEKLPPRTRGKGD